MLTGRLDEVSRGEHNRYLDSAALAAGLFGDATTANILLLGVAVQQGAIAVDPAHVERAIELNGVAVARNVAAFRWGRRWVVAPDEVATGGRHPGARRPGDGRRADRPPRRRPRRLPVRGATPSASATWSTSPARRSGGVDPASTALHRGGRPPRPQADGLQGRVRGRPAAARPRGAPGVRGRRRAGHQGHVAAAPADAAGPRDEGEDAPRPADEADAGGAGPRQAGPRARSPTRSAGPRCAASSGR